MKKWLKFELVLVLFALLIVTMESCTEKEKKGDEEKKETLKKRKVEKE